MIWDQLVVTARYIEDTRRLTSTPGMKGNLCDEQNHGGRGKRWIGNNATRK